MRTCSAFALFCLALVGCSQPQASLSMTITLEGAPLGDADVRLLRADKDRLIDTGLKGKTDWSGNVSFSRLAAGTYVVEVERSTLDLKGIQLSVTDYRDASRDQTRFTVKAGKNTQNVKLRLVQRQWPAKVEPLDPRQAEPKTGPLETLGFGHTWSAAGSTVTLTVTNETGVTIRQTTGKIYFRTDRGTGGSYSLNAGTVGAGGAVARQTVASNARAVTDVVVELSYVTDAGPVTVKATVPDWRQ